MSLNHHARELRDTLEALDFRYDERESQRRGGGAYYRHYAEPEQYIKVFPNITPLAARTAMDKARQIAGLATVGKKTSGAIRDQARFKRSTEKVAQLQRQLAVERRADEIGLQRRTAQQRAQRDRELREIRDLMRPAHVKSNPNRPWDSPR